LATEKFADLARQSAQQIGLDRARIATVQHPVGGVADSELVLRADAAVDRLIELLTSWK